MTLQQVNTESLALFLSAQKIASKMLLMVSNGSVYSKSAIVCFQMAACTLFTVQGERSEGDFLFIFCSFLFINKHWTCNKFNEIHEDTGDKAVFCFIHFPNVYCVFAIY